MEGLQGDQAQLLQPIFIGEVFQPYEYLHDPPQDLLQHTLLVLGALPTPTLYDQASGALCIPPQGWQCRGIAVLSCRHLVLLGHRKSASQQRRGLGPSEHFLQPHQPVVIWGAHPGATCLL